MESNHVVLIFNSNRFDFIGGGEYTTKMLYDGLGLKGYRIKIINPTRGSSERSQNILQTLEGKTYITEERNFTNFRGPFFFLFRPLPALESFSSEAVNLVLISRLPPFRYFEQVRNTGKIVIFLLHGIAIENFHVGNIQVVLYQIYLRIQLRLLIFLICDMQNLHFQVLNNNILLYLRKIKVPTSNTHLIPSGVPVKEYAIQRNDEEFLVIFLGRINDVQKNVSLFLRFARKILSRNQDKIRVVLMGPIEQKKLIKDISDLTDDFQGRASYLGTIDENKKRDILSRGSLFLCTSNLEPFSLSVVEALSSGVPVISTPVSGPSYILSLERAFGEISSFHVRDLVKSAEYFFDKWLNNPDDYFALRKKIRDLCLTHLNDDRMINGYKQMIDQVRKSKERRRR